MPLIEPRGLDLHSSKAATSSAWVDRMQRGMSRVGVTAPTEAEGGGSGSEAEEVVRVGKQVCEIDGEGGVRSMLPMTAATARTDG